MLVQPLTDITVLKTLLENHGIETSKAMGQNFLTSPEVVEATLAVLEHGPKKITELGPGVGSLTQAVVESGYTVRAIEKDDEFIKVLPTVISKKNRPNLTIVHADLKEAEWTWKEPYQLIGNIPYNLSGYIIRHITQLEPAPHQVVLLVQKEVGQRMTAREPDTSLLSLSIALWGKAQKVLNVPPNCFWPQPTIHSQLVLLTPHTNAQTSVEERENILEIAHVFFQQKRKQIGGMMQREFLVSDTEMSQILTTIQSTPTTRPQELSADQWKTLAEILISKQKK